MVCKKKISRRKTEPRGASQCTDERMHVLLLILRGSVRTFSRDIIRSSKEEKRAASR
jgi:hypothetical protein